MWWIGFGASAAKHMSTASAITLPPPPARPSILAMGYPRHVPEPLADRPRKTKAARMGHHFGSGSNSAQTRVGYEEIRNRALHAKAVIASRAVTVHASMLFRSFAGAGG